MVCYFIMPKIRLTEMSVDQPQKSQSMDCDKCSFCQDNKDEALQWPLGTKRRTYIQKRQMEKQLQQFKNLGLTHGIECDVIGRRQSNNSNQHLLIIKPNGIRIAEIGSKAEKQRLYTSSDTTKATRQSCTWTNIFEENSFFSVIKVLEKFTWFLPWI